MCRGLAKVACRRHGLGGSWKAGPEDDVQKFGRCKDGVCLLPWWGDEFGTHQGQETGVVAWKQAFSSSLFVLHLPEYHNLQHGIVKNDSLNSGPGVFLPKYRIAVHTQPPFMV